VKVARCQSKKDVWHLLNAKGEAMCRLHAEMLDVRDSTEVDRTKICRNCDGALRWKAKQQRPRRQKTDFRPRHTFDEWAQGLAPTSAGRAPRFDPTLTGIATVERGPGDTPGLITTSHGNRARRFFPEDT
jgi:hypothetical protein